MTRKSKAKSSLSARIVLIFAKAALCLLLLSVGIVSLFRWVDPPTSMVMTWDWLGRVADGADTPRIRHDWVDYDRISPEFAIAVVAAEDQRFPDHPGFDLEELRQAVATKQQGGRLRGASTISQQVAKNLFLWHGRSFVRKAIEAYFTILIELTWPKRRILEIYMNIAELGDGIYGVEAASRYFFERPAGEINRDQAALMAAVLPNPRQYRVDSPSGYVRERQSWILRQMQNLGGRVYLDSL